MQNIASAFFSSKGRQKDWTSSLFSLFPDLYKNYTGDTLVVNIYFMGTFTNILNWAGGEGGMGLSLFHSSLASTDKCKHPPLNKQPLPLFPLSFSVIRSTFNYFLQNYIKPP